MVLQIFDYITWFPILCFLIVSLHLFLILLTFSLPFISFLQLNFPPRVIWVIIESFILIKEPLHYLYSTFFSSVLVKLSTFWIRLFLLSKGYFVYQKAFILAIRTIFTMKQPLKISYNQNWKGYFEVKKRFLTLVLNIFDI